MHRLDAVGGLAAAAAASVLMMGSCQGGGTDETGPLEQPPSAAAASVDAATEEALLAALDDERRAEGLYKAVIARFGEVRPFTNIVQAEERHQQLLLPLFKRYGVPVPPNPHDPASMDVPATLTEACADGVRSERENIAMYDRLLPEIEEPDIRAVFEQLRNASAGRHLPAFERCAGGGGRGRRG